MLSRSSGLDAAVQVSGGEDADDAENDEGDVCRRRARRDFAGRLAVLDDLPHRAFHLPVEGAEVELRRALHGAEEHGVRDADDGDVFLEEAVQVGADSEQPFACRARPRRPRTMAAVNSRAAS